MLYDLFMYISKSGKLKTWCLIISEILKTISSFEQILSNHQERTSQIPITGKLMLLKVETEVTLEKEVLPGKVTMTLLRVEVMIFTQVVVKWKYVLLVIQ